MTPNRQNRNNTVSASKHETVSVAEEAASRANERSKKATSRIFLVLRLFLFVGACVFAVLGVKGFLDASNVQTVSNVATMEAIKGEPTRSAFVLFSRDDSDASVTFERSGAVRVLNNSGVATDVMYLDANNANKSNESQKRTDDAITEKAKEAGGYDIIVAAGNDALLYVLKHQSLFGGIPVVYFAVNDKELVDASSETGIATGFYEDGAAESILKEAADLLPKAQNVVVLSDGTLEAQGLLGQLENAKGVASSITRDVWDVSKTTRDELAEKLGALTSDSFVLLLSAGIDSQGNVYRPSETSYFLGKSATAPVFSAGGGVGEGICGGAFIDRESEGANAAKLAIELLNGSKIADKPYTTVKPECNVFDVGALGAHGINPDNTAANATLVNEPTFSARVLRPMIQPALFMLLAIACIAAFGIIGFRRSMQSNRAIIASRNDLHYRLYHDVLTELPNRHALDQFASNSDKNSNMRSLVQIDINDFTAINESFGHAFGNDVLRIVGKRLSGVKSALLARSGGDEFTLAFDHELSSESHELGQINRLLNDPVIVGDNKVDLSASIGVANREPGMTGDDMIIFADLATLNAKDNNIHHPVFYSHDMRDAMERKREVNEYLKLAIAEESVNVVWQPQVKTADLTVYGYEALCRLKDNRYYPSDFIPVAEMSGLVVPIGRIVTKKVVEQLGAWLKEGRNVGVTSINYSAAQLRDKEYCNYLADLLAKHEVPASLIKIEITESMIMDNEDDAARLFSRLRSMGVTLALDDFGTGYSSLYQMATRPVDVVKLDKSLVDAYMIPGKEGFIEDVTKLIHGIDKEIVVEGVETLEQFTMCQEFGIDIIQGYFFSRPVSADEAIEFDPITALPGSGTDKEAANGKGRNADWHKYDRDAHGRWTKKSKK